MALASLVVFFGALTQSLIGFGMAVVAAPLLYLIEPSLVPAPVILMGFSIALLTLLRERGALEFNGLQYALLGRIPGGLIGAGLLLVAPQAVLGMTIAIIVAIAVLLSLLRLNLVVNRRSLFIAGVISGIFGNIAAIGGIFSSTIAMVILGLTGLLTLHHFYCSALLLPSVLLGYLTANRLVGRIDKNKTRIMTLVLCSLSAILLAAKSLSSLL
nr:TSUP family transporter [Shewanella insulae]